MEKKVIRGRKVLELKLSKDLHGLGHIVLHDNYFTSVELMESLLEDTIYECGTAKMDRRYMHAQHKDVLITVIIRIAVSWVMPINSPRLNVL